MENIILSGMLRDFVIRHGLEAESSDRQFEKFANYCLLKTDHYDSFDFEKVSTGDCVGIDGVAVSIGGVIVDELQDAEAFTRMQFDARFIFSQAKTSAKFDLGDFLKFTSTVRNFFGNDRAAVPLQLQKAFDVKQHIYGRAAAKLRQAPTAELCYVYSGRFDARNETLRQQLEHEAQTLRAMPYLFSVVNWHIYDGDAISRLYRETQNDVQVDIPFQRHVALPKIRGARSAYLGVVRCSDYVRMIRKENGDLNKGLFFENVRDFLGTRNTVNEDIAKTIQETAERDRFAILNNGVTLVAKSVTPSGDTFKISQFQVVNGCQTSHVLFNSRDAITEEMYLTVKLIETSDVDLSGQIIATTNSQSQVTREAFATIRPYHRVLEDFFNAMRTSGLNYYYERRPHQYDDRHDIRQTFIVSPPQLIQSFLSVILEEPHKVHYYYGTLLSEYNKNKTSELFSESDYPGLYFAAHHITYRCRIAASRDKYLKDWGFHIALLVKRMLAPELAKGTAINDGKFLGLIKKLDAGFDEAFGVVSDFLSNAKLFENENRSAEVTAQLVSDFGKALSRENRPVKTAPIPSTELRLADGRYVGVLASADKAKRRASVRYGPFRVEGDAGDDDVLSLPSGARVAFVASGGRVTVSSPLADR